MTNLSECKFCLRELGQFESRYLVQEQRSRNGRWLDVGFCCEECLKVDGNVRDLRARTWGEHGQD